MLAPFGIRPKGTLAVRMLPLAQALVQRGHRVHIIAPPVHNPQDAGQTTTYDGVVVTHTPQPPLAFASSVQHTAFLLNQVVADKPDLVHLFKPKGYSGLAAVLLRMLRPSLPLVVDTDDWEGWGGWNDLLPYPYAAKLLFAWQERDLPRRADGVTVASRTLQTQVWGHGVAPERVVYLPNGIWQHFTLSPRGGAQSGLPPSPVPSPTSGRRGAVGAYGGAPNVQPPLALWESEQGEEGCCPIPNPFPQGEKGNRAGVPPFPCMGWETEGTTAPPTLLLYTRFWEFAVPDVIAALVAIVQQRPDVRVLVIGKGERGEEHDLLRLATQAGIVSALDYCGWVEPSVLPLLFAEADIALAPMDDTLINRARCSVKLLELMAAGLPVIAGQVGQVMEYITHGESGILVAPSNPAALAQATLRLLDDTPLRLRLGKAAQARVVQHFNWDTLASTVEHAYGLALNG